MAEVGEAGHVEVDAVDAVARERLGAHLHGHGLDLALAHEGEEGVELGCFGRRQSRDDDLARDVPFGGRGEPGDDVDLVEDAGEQMGDARLAVGPGGREEQGSGSSAPVP